MNADEQPKQMTENFLRYQEVYNDLLVKHHEAGEGEESAELQGIRALAQNHDRLVMLNFKLLGLLDGFAGEVTEAGNPADVVDIATRFIQVVSQNLGFYDEVRMYVSAVSSMHLSMMMREDGVDPTDEEQVRAWFSKSALTSKEYAESVVNSFMRKAEVASA